MINLYILPAGKTPTELQIEENSDSVFITLDEYPAYEQHLIDIDDEIQIIIVETEMFKLAKTITAIFDAPTKCWICNSHASNKKGYRRFSRKNNMESVHRYVYKFYHSDPGPGMDVCHDCDTPGCCNPYHLNADTHPENMRQMAERGRSAKGERNGQSKLTENEVISILVDKVSSPKELATRYRVSDETIRLIKRGELWKHINREDITRISGVAV